MNETSPAPSTTRQPTHDEISQKAKELWESYGRPAGRDEEIWFEAERALQSPSSNPSSQSNSATASSDFRSNAPGVSSTPPSSTPASSAGGAVATPKMPAARGGKRRSA